jgi:PAS domain S-box-containing protein
MPIQSVSLLLITILILAVGVVLILRRKAPGSIDSISMMVVVVAIWIIANLLHNINKTYIPLNVLRSINYLCLAFAASSQLLFAFAYTNRTRWLTSTTYILLLFEPILTQILFWAESSRVILFNPESRIWVQINIIYVSHLLAASIFLFTETFLNKPRLHFRYSGTILAGAIFPMIGNLLIFMSHGDPEVHIYLAIFSYSLAIAGFSYGKFNSHLIEATPLTRDMVVEGMDDGWMVVDRQNKVIDINSAAEKMTGMSREQIYGLPVNQILNEWNKVSQSSEGIKELEMRRTVKAQNDLRYLNIRISQLVDGNNSPFGHLIVWRDITGRKLADAIHQRARDELFVLLNAISSLASRSMNLEDFLSEFGYQIVYSFHSQGIATFLTEEKDGDKQKLSLKSHFGFSPEHVNTINSKTISENIYNWLIRNEENRPLVLDHQNRSASIPFIPTDIGFNYVALIPLIIYTQHENNILGCLCLGRNKDTIYSQDEVIRLTTIANQFATLIDSNRRKQSAIALNERQRLLRDLHDSVSQKLYGLVALTEAAQAGIEAGSEIAPVEVLSRIGENARQAVKEMRLFLYEMQPIDLKDGLVSSLQHRLAAVEGRADIKARMISDENIQLEKDNEIALYYIAQEALNNILRHAHARNVSVNLKQTRQNVILEIQDDGQGFNMKKIDNSGMGLRNMKERAIRANGKFKIISKVKTGTKIVVSVARKVQA